MRSGWASALGAAVVLALGCDDRERSASADGLVRTTGAVDFRRVAIYDGRELDVQLENVGRANLRILEVLVEDEHGQYAARMDEPAHPLVPGGACTAKVRFTPRHPGTAPAQLVIRTDSRLAEEVRVPLSGEGVDASAVLLARRVDLGRIEVGGHSEAELPLENRSDMEVRVTPRLFGADRDEFEVAPLTLAPGEARSLKVAFGPSRVGIKTVALAVSPCAGCPDVPVEVAAEGLDRAVIAEPADLDFGQVPMDRDLVLTVQLRNLSTQPQVVGGMALDPATDPGFTAVDGSLPAPLAPGATAAFTFRFSPGHMGGATGRALFQTQSQRHPELPVGLFGFGGAAELCIAPTAYDFGTQPVGAKVGVPITLKNCGSPGSSPLELSELRLVPPAGGAAGAVDQFSIAAVPLPRVLQAGEELEVRVFFEPTRAGTAQAALSVRSTGFAASLGRVELAGSGEVHAPCDLAITPIGVDFGTVRPGRGAVLGVKVVNVGTDLCPVKNIRLADDAEGAFFMPGGEIDGVILPRNTWFSFQVAFVAPEEGGTLTGLLQIEQANPGVPRRYVPLTAHSEPTCLSASPPYLDFGATRVDCPGLPMRTTISNRCQSPVELQGAYVGPGTTDGEFAISAAPAFPLALGPGESIEVEVSYAAATIGSNYSPLYLEGAGLPRPFLVPLLGTLSKRGDRVDRFTQQDGSKVDVLFVVDNTASMVEEHPRLVAAIPAFVDAALARSVDLHVAVTTTGIEPVSSACPGGAQGGEAGRFFPVDGSAPRVLSSATPELTARLQANVQVGQCAIVERGLEAMLRALTAPLVDSADDLRTPIPSDGNLGFLREDAALAVVIVGDEDDNSSGSVEDYVRALRTLKGANQPQRAAVFAIAPTAQACASAGGVGTRYEEAAVRTGGEVMSICEPSYAPLLQAVAQKAFSPQTTFPLSAIPDPSGVRVLVDGVERSSGVQYDAAANAVVLDIAPGPGAKVELHYRRACGG
jgi:hypothetical protein